MFVQVLDISNDSNGELMVQVSVGVLIVLNPGCWTWGWFKILHFFDEFPKGRLKKKLIGIFQLRWWEGVSKGSLSN